MRHMTKNELLMIQSKGGEIPSPPKDMTRLMAEQAIATMKDTVNHNGAVYAEIVKMMTHKPVRFDIHRDNMGNMVSVIPIYEKVL